MVREIIRICKLHEPHINCNSNTGTIQYFIELDFNPTAAGNTIG